MLYFSIYIIYLGHSVGLGWAIFILVARWDWDGPVRHCRVIWCLCDCFCFCSRGTGLCSTCVSILVFLLLVACMLVCAGLAWMHVEMKKDLEILRLSVQAGNLQLCDRSSLKLWLQDIYAGLETYKKLFYVNTNEVIFDLNINIYTYRYMTISCTCINYNVYLYNNVML